MRSDSWLEEVVQQTIHEFLFHQYPIKEKSYPFSEASPPRRRHDGAFKAEPKLEDACRGHPSAENGYLHSSYTPLMTEPTTTI
jgi:hypothetical protein